MYTNAPIRIIIADGDPERGQSFAGMLRGAQDSLAATFVAAEHLIPAILDLKPSLAIIDSSLLGGAEQVRREFPDLAIVLTSPRIDDAQIETAVRLGVSAVLRSPCEPGAVMRILQRPTPAAELKGTSRGVSSATLLALHCGAGSDGVLHLATPEHGSGAIHLEGGQPVHASVGELSGPEAVRVLLSWADAVATWIPGRTGCARTIIGRWEGLLERPSMISNGASDEMIPLAYPDVMEKLARLAQTPDIIGAFLLRNAEVITGRCSSQIDEGIAGRALCRLAHVYHDMDGQQSNDDGSTEIQATIGNLRLVVDQIGPDPMGFQVGVIVRQASPVCKSLRRLLRQIDRSFRKSLDNTPQYASNSNHDPNVRAAS